MYFSHMPSKQLIFQRLGTNCEHFSIANSKQTKNDFFVCFQPLQKTKLCENLLHSFVYKSNIIKNQVFKNQNVPYILAFVFLLVFVISMLILWLLL